MWFNVHMQTDAAAAIRNGEFVIGKEAFAKISAIEGIYLTPEMEKDLDTFEAEGLSGPERDAAILRKYGPSR